MQNASPPPSSTPRRVTNDIELTECPSSKEMTFAVSEKPERYFQYLSDEGYPYYVSEKGDPVWELPVNAEVVDMDVKLVNRKRYVRFVSEGVEYFVSEDGSESLWELPQGAVLMNNVEISEEEVMRGYG